MYDLEKWCSEITRRWIQDPKASAQFEFLGVKPNLWPECEPKKLITIFLSLKASKGEFVAKAECLEKSYGLQEFDLPDDPDVFKVKFDRMILEARFRNLGSKLSKTPSNGFDLIAEFNQERADSVRLINAYEFLGELVSVNDKRAQDGTNLVTLVGWEKISQGIGGWGQQRVSILIAGTGVGKTTLAINLARAANKSGMEVLFINMEMSEHDLGARLVESETGMTHQRWISGAIDYVAMSEMSDEWGKRKPFLFTSGKALSLDEISATITATATKNEMRFIVVDYDQKIITQWKDEEWKVLHRAVEQLEQIAKHTHSHIMILAQGNDDGDPKASKRIKQVASTVLHFSRANHGSKFYFLRATKNRFGVQNFTVSVNYDPARARATEGDILTDQDFKDDTWNLLKR